MAREFLSRARAWGYCWKKRRENLLWSTHSLSLDFMFVWGRFGGAVQVYGKAKATRWYNHWKSYFQNEFDWFSKTCWLVATSNVPKEGAGTEDETSCSGLMLCHWGNSRKRSWLHSPGHWDLWRWGFRHHAWAPFFGDCNLIDSKTNSSVCFEIFLGVANGQSGLGIIRCSRSLHSAPSAMTRTSVYRTLWQQNKNTVCVWREPRCIYINSADIYWVATMCQAPCAALMDFI